MDTLAALAVAFLQLASLTFEQLRETVDAIVSTLADQYVEPAEGIRLGHALSQELEQGRLPDDVNTEAFAAAVQRFLQAETRDRHLLVCHGAPVDILKIAPGGRLQGPAIGRTELRPDGVGYVEVRHFLNENQGNAAIAGQIDGAMRTVASASALVFDLRPNPGGDLSAVAHLSTYLFASRTQLLSRTVRGRAGTIDVWTRDEVPGPRLPQLPVYVLTSADTVRLDRPHLRSAQQQRLAGRRRPPGSRSARRRRTQCRARHGCAAPEELQHKVKGPAIESPALLCSSRSPKP